MMIHHQPSDDLLLDYASGALPEAVALAVATHAALCPDSLKRIDALETVGGALIDDVPPESMAEDALAHALAAIDVAPSGKTDSEQPVGFDDGTLTAVPAPLRPYLGRNLADMEWRRLNRHVESATLQTRRDDHQLRLLRICAGAAVPEHTHRGGEITVTLTGGYSDGFNHYERGDFQYADPSLTHRPRADEGEDCLCLVVLDAPIRLTGPLGRLIDPFVKI
jgi:putative transcriptional regulator